MDTIGFLGLEPTHNRFRWKLPVTDGIATDGDFMFGGAGLAAAIAALEGTSGRPCVWATAQYLSYARPGEVVDIDVRLAVEGHQITQARAVCHVADREILGVNAALGTRDFDQRARFEQMPTGVPAPLDCPPRRALTPGGGRVLARVEQRIARGRQLDQLDGSRGDGRTLLWARLAELDGSLDAAALALLGDFVPYGINQALGTPGSANSLDNTLRIVDLVPTEWVLLDITAQAVERGFGHGISHLYSLDGTLLATASQSCIMRYELKRADGLDQRG